MNTIQPPQPRSRITRRLAYRYYAVGAIMHALAGAVLAGRGHLGSTGLFVVAGILAVVAIVTWRRKTLLETRHPRVPTDPTVLHTDRQ